MKLNALGRQPQVRSGLLLSFVFSAGVGLITYSAQIDAGHWREVIRDVGVAFIVAALVTIIFEVYERARATQETMEHVLNRVMGDVVDKSLWEELKAQILTKTAIRGNTTLTMEVFTPPGAVGGILGLRTTLMYELKNLRSFESKAKVSHFVDAFMPPANGVSPGIKLVKLDGRSLDIEDPSHFLLELNLNGAGGAPRELAIHREELVYLPGAYNFIFSELTHLKCISLISAPSNVKVTVNCKFEVSELTAKEDMRLGYYMLPSQCLEIRFEKR